jgi:hypothetical protein
MEQQYQTFRDILSDQDLQALFSKHGIEDVRQRKLPVRHFLWLMVLSATQPAARGSLLQLIGFFLGTLPLIAGKPVKKLSKTALSKRLGGVSWYLFRGVYNHLLEKYKNLLNFKELQILSQFKDAFAIDGSVISLCKQLEKLFASVHQGKSSLKLNTKYSLKLEAVTKLQVSTGRRHDSRFSFVTQAPQQLYLVDLGYWSFRLMKRIIDAGSFFVMRLKSSCDPLIVAVNRPEFQPFVGQRLSDMSQWLKQQAELSEIDLSVQLSSAKKPKFKEEVRLIGLLYEGQWRFYVTNIIDPAFTPQLLYELYALRWQVEIFFNVLKHVLHLDNIVARTKNGIMIEIYSALILHLLTRIVIALAAQKRGLPIHDYSFERSFKLVKGVVLANIRLFFSRSLQGLDALFDRLVEIVAEMGVRETASPIVALEQQLSR